MTKYIVVVSVSYVIDAENRDAAISEAEHRLLESIQGAYISDIFSVDVVEKDTDNIRLRLSDYRKLVKEDKCRWCGAFLPEVVKCYPHYGGWTVLGFDVKQWLYITCPECGYDWAIWKLGVPRE